MTFLFDIGRVLLDFEFEPSLAKLLPPGITDARGRLELLLERKDDFEAGRIAEDDYIGWAIGTMESSATPDEFRHAWCDIFTPNTAMWAVVDRLLADGHRLILFSNINTIHANWIAKTYPEFEKFHGRVFSFEAGAIKADPAIYRHAIETFGLIAAETRYIDDLPANIATGREMGMRVWQYDLKAHAAFERWLEAELAQ